MKPIGTITLTQEGAGQTLEMKNWPSGKAASGIRLRVKTYIKNISAGALTPAIADVVSAIRRLFAPLTLSYGESDDSHVPLNGVMGDELRDTYRFLAEDDFATDFITGGSVAAGATVQRMMDILVFFDADKYEGVVRRLVGYIQGRSMKLTVQESGSKTITAAQWERGAGNTTIDVYPVTQEGPNFWSPVLSIAKATVTDLEVMLADGLPLGVFDCNSAASATALSRFQLLVGRYLEHDQVEPVIITDEYARELDAGGANVLDTLTALYFASKGRPLEMQPHGAPRMRQNTLEIATWKARAVYYPTINEAELHEAARVASKQLESPVLVTRVPEPQGAWHGSAACLPCIIHTPDEAEYHERAGVVGTPDGSTRFVVPPGLVKKAEAMSSLETHPAAREMLARKAQKLIAVQAGTVSTTGKSAGAARMSIREALSGLFRR